MNSRQLFEHYVAGLQDYRKRFYSNTDSAKLYKKLVEEGQRPPTMLIACCDSRANPSDILNLLPGDAFIFRSIANLVPKYSPNPDPNGTAAALEYAVTVLNVQHIILMAHSKCGGVQALLNPSALQKNSFISSWVNQASAARETTLKNHTHAEPEAKAKACEEEVLRLSLANLMTYPWIKERVENGTLSLNAWRFDMETGNISCLNQTTNMFEDLLTTLPKAKL